MLPDKLIAVTAQLAAFWAQWFGPNPAEKACRLIQERHPSIVTFAGLNSEVYDRAVEHAFVNAEQNSTCVVEPTTPEEVATVLETVGRSDIRSPFAIKSGGHSYNPGHSSTSGVLLSMRNFKEVTYDAQAQTAKVGTGNNWREVYAALEPHGVVVAGGRVNAPGVGGFSLGGGYNWKTDQVGLTIDTIVAFDVVLPTGKIVHVTEAEEPDLFFALKGGLNNFGVVTAITMQTYEQTDVYAGFMIYLEDGVDAIARAVADFTAANTDPKAVLMFSSSYHGGHRMGTLMLYYDAPTPPPGIFDEMLAIPTLQGEMKTRSFRDYLAIYDADMGFGPIGTVSQTIPISSYPYELLVEINKQVAAVGERLQAAAPPGRMVFTSFVSEPFVAPFTHSKGGAYPHNIDNHLTPGLSFLFYSQNRSDSYQAQQDLWKSYSEELKPLTQAIVDKAVELGVSKPTDAMYANYAHGDTDASRIFGENLGRLREIAAKVDPERVMPLSGGFVIQDGSYGDHPRSEEL